MLVGLNTLEAGIYLKFKIEHKNMFILILRLKQLL